MSEITTILDFLGEENEEKIKTQLTNSIIYNLDESVRCDYFVCPDTLSQQLEECWEKVLKKHKKEITDAMEMKVLRMIDKIATEE